MAATTAAATISPFSRAVVNTMRRLFPEALADKSFDNTGLLLEAPMRTYKRQQNSVLLTVDLTRAVAEEAIQKEVSIVISYHPTIFKPLKSLTLADSQQESLLRLVQEGISVYSPHTALDAAPKGLNHWLADIVTGRHPGDPVMPGTSGEVPNRYLEHERSVISPVRDVEGMPNAGMGRIIRFAQAQPLQLIIGRIAGPLGSLTHCQSPDPPDR